MPIILQNNIWRSTKRCNFSRKKLESKPKLNFQDNSLPISLPIHMHVSRKPPLIILSDWFAPGYRAGGPITSCVNLSYAMRKYFDVKIITSDRDLGDRKPYDSILPNSWTQYDNGIHVLYCRPGFSRIREIRKILRQSAKATILLNGMFSRSFTLIPLFLLNRLDKDHRIILTPRGMLKPSALAIKHWKKNLFLSLMKRWKFVRQITFHVTDQNEQEDVLRVFGENSRVHVIPNCTPLPQPPEKNIEKNPGTLKVISVARIHPIKNTLFLINSLATTHQKVILDLYGPIEDMGYWKTCLQKIRSLPSNVQVTHQGELQPHQVRSYIKRYHVFGLATKGENFGHAIYEALSTGTPVLISDQTPWRNLRKAQAGWDLPLKDSKEFGRIVNLISSYTQPEYDQWSKGAYTLAEDFRAKHNVNELYKELFYNAA